MAEGDRLRADVEEIYAAGERAARLTGQLLAFSRRQMLLPQVVDINSLIDQMKRTLRRLVGEGIDLSFTLAPDLQAVRVDPASIEQVLVNLAMNARLLGGLAWVIAALAVTGTSYGARDLARAVASIGLTPTALAAAGASESSAARAIRPSGSRRMRAEGKVIAMGGLF